MLRYLASNLAIVVLLVCLSCQHSAKGPGALATDTITKGKIGVSRINHDSGLSSQYENAKWAIYCICGTKMCQFFSVKGKADSTPFAELELKFREIRRSGDSTELYFDFYRDAIKCDAFAVKDEWWLQGVGFFGGQDSIAYFISPTTARFINPGTFVRHFTNPLYQSWIGYLKSNTAKLDPWLRGEAVRRGAISN